MRELLTKLSVPEDVLSFIDEYLLITTLGVAVLGVLIAFFGYKFFKALLVIGGAIGAGIAVNQFLLPLFIDKLPEISFIGLPAIITIVGAGIGALIGFKARKLCVFLGAGVGAYFLAHDVLYKFIYEIVPSGWTFMENSIIKIAVSVVFAIILACICEAFSRIAIPKDLHEIEDFDAFGGCDALTDISFGGTRERWESVMRGKVLTVQKSDLSIYTPKLTFINLE